MKLPPVIGFLFYAARKHILRHFKNYNVYISMHTIATARINPECQE